MKEWEMIELPMLDPLVVELKRLIDNIKNDTRHLWQYGSNCRNGC